MYSHAGRPHSLLDIFSSLSSCLFERFFFFLPSEPCHPKKNQNCFPWLPLFLFTLEFLSPPPLFATDTDLFEH